MCRYYGGCLDHAIEKSWRDLLLENFDTKSFRGLVNFLKKEKLSQYAERVWNVTEGTTRERLWLELKKP